MSSPGAQCCLPSSFLSLGEFTSLWLWDWGLCFIAGYRLGTTLIFIRLPTFNVIPSYVEYFSWFKYLSHLLPATGESSQVISKHILDNLSWIIYLAYNITAEVKSHHSHRIRRLKQESLVGHIRNSASDRLNGSLLQISFYLLTKYLRDTPILNWHRIVHTLHVI